MAVPVRAAPATISIAIQKAILLSSPVRGELVSVSGLSFSGSEGVSPGFEGSDGSPVVPVAGISTAAFS